MSDKLPPEKIAEYRRLRESAGWVGEWCSNCETHWQEHDEVLAWVELPVIEVPVREGE